MKRWIQQLNEYLTSQLKPDELEKFLGESVNHDAEINTVIDELLHDRVMCGFGTEEQRLRILERIRRKQKGSISSWYNIQPPYRYLAIAAMVLLLLSSTWLLLRNTKPEQRLAAATRILPATDKATLTLSNGTTITLNSTANNTIEETNGMQILNLSGGELKYSSTTKSGQSAPAGYNTLTTPRGGRYHIILPDGTKVWLNTASSLRFPLAFTGPQRMVEITGEAYLEVADKASQPFTVNTPNQQVQVLGTGFNINAYPDEEEAVTTLLHGKVAIISGTAQQLLAPGQQASTKLPEHTIQVKTVDTSDAVSWMKDKFLFTGANINTVMRQIQRWYAIDVTFEKGFDQYSKFSGSISMNQNLAEVLKVLELSGIQFKVHDHSLTVLSVNKQ